MNANQFSAILDVLAKRLGTTVQMLWSVLIRQEIVNGLADIVWALIGLLLFAAGVVTIVKLVRFVRSDNYNEYEHGGWSLTGFIMAGIAGVIGVIVMVICIPDGAAHFVNPAYYALNDVAGMFTSNKSN